MKGVSPVVATVLLIAIAVIAAVGVWYWSANYLNKPVDEPVSRTLLVQSCNLTHALVRNIGGAPAEVDADLFNSDGSLVGRLNISGTTLNSTAIMYVPIVNASNSSQIIALAKGMHKVIDSEYPQTQFLCE
jgi:flagellin-like protein